MVLSGIALVIYDSRIIHRWLRKLKNQFRKKQREQQVEIGDNSNPQGDVNPRELQLTEPEPTPIRVDSDGDGNFAAEVRQEQPIEQDDTSAENPARTVRSEEVKVPYSITTGLVIFVLFLVSFIVIMVTRGVVHDLPIVFRFFANMYLAGISPAISRC